MLHRLRLRDDGAEIAKVRALQVDEAVVVEMAEAGKLPGRKLGAAWRFSRAALVAWLSTPDGKGANR